MQSARWLDQKVQDRTVMSCLADTASLSNRARAFETLAQYVEHFHGAAHAFSQPGHNGLSAQEIYHRPPKLPPGVSEAIYGVEG